MSKVYDAAGEVAEEPERSMMNIFIEGNDPTRPVNIFDLDAPEFHQALLNEAGRLCVGGRYGFYAMEKFIEDATVEWGCRRKEKAKAMARAAIRMPWVRR